MPAHRIGGAITAIALLSAATMALGHGDVAPQPINTDALPEVGEEWLTENPYREEAAGHEVVREFRIGQREVYVPEIESGAIDLFPEYTGPLLQYFKRDFHPDQETHTATDKTAAALAIIGKGGL